MSEIKVNDELLAKITGGGEPQLPVPTETCPYCGATIYLRLGANLDHVEKCPKNPRNQKN